MTFGDDWGWGSSVADSVAIIDRFIDRGGNFIDTANAYTKGHSERSSATTSARTLENATVWSSPPSS
jgi:aryl-alcohol dehydrogenase-like predicted oxidoreductase